jgi:branched-chain amino acid transport system permease protein
MDKNLGRKRWFWVLCLVAITIILPFILPIFWTRLATEILCFSIFAMSYNIVMGYGGMMSFGHAGFYGGASYLVAILLTKTAIPAMIALVLSCLFGAFLGLVIGFFCVRLRAFYLAILTMAFSQLIWAVIFKWYDMTGGDNGIIGIPIPAFISTIENMYFFTLIITIFCFYIFYRIIHSPFGLTLVALRENTQRIEFVGVNSNRYRLYAFTISTFFSGLAGGMYCLISRGVFPDIASWGKSGEVLLCCVLGGMHNFFGPAVGSILMILLENVIGSYTQRWPIILGILFVLIVFFLPRGVLGYNLKDIVTKFQRKGGMT